MYYDQNILASTPNVENIPVLTNRDDINKYYQIHDEKLGEGGFAKVRLGTHRATGQTVAIKCFDKIKLANELPRVYTEIKCLRHLNHPSIARLYDVFETETAIYLVLERCHGGELFDYIVRKTRLDEAEAGRIFRDLIFVLDHIHLKGIAHRDLKTENVLFDDKKQIKLIDFGLAANCTAENLISNPDQRPMDQLSTCCGSVTYAAPEIISGNVYKGTEVDIWSAGVVLYAMVCGQLPFNDNSIPKLYRKIQTGLQTLPSFISPGLGDLLRKMLTCDPSKRITIREILIHEWFRQIRFLEPKMAPVVTRRLQYKAKSPNGSTKKSSPLTAINRGSRYNMTTFKTPTKVRYNNVAPSTPKSINKLSSVENNNTPFKTPTKVKYMINGTPASSENHPIQLDMTPFKTPAKVKYAPSEKRSIVQRILQSWTPSKLKQDRKILIASVKHFP